MNINHFTDHRIEQLFRGQPLTREERVFLIEDTLTFEECDKTEGELTQMTDRELIDYCYGVWTDYSRLME
jgi:hypothetical protein